MWVWIVQIMRYMLIWLVSSTISPFPDPKLLTTLLSDKSTQELFCVYTGTVLPLHDFLTDNSLQKFVSPQIWLTNIRYKPVDLTPLVASDILQVRNHKWLLRQEATQALYQMASWFYAVFKKPLVVISSYRWYEYQKSLVDWYIGTLGANRAAALSARPGHSEHQLWLAIDVFDASTNAAFYSGYKSYVDWLQANAHIYGWTQSYQKWRDIDGYVIEPWHWRYVWIELATYLWENKMSFGEYVKMRQLWHLEK